MTDFPASVTVISSEKPAFLGKTYEMTSGGLQKATAGQMSAGTYEVREIRDVTGLKQLLQQMATIRR